MNVAMRSLLHMLSPAGRAARLSILIFHRVLPLRDPLFPGEVTAQEFAAICDWVSRWFKVLPLDVAARQLAGGNLPARALSITFDDGYADNHEVAMPILLERGLPATFFVASGFLDGGRMWNDTVIESVRRARAEVLDLRGSVADALGCLPLRSVDERRSAIEQLIRSTKYLPSDARAEWVATIAGRSDAALPDDLMMRSDQVRALHEKGMTVGAHTVSHPILANLDPPAIEKEIRDGRDALEAIIGAPVRVFAYPNGRPGQDYGPNAVDVVRSLGFDAAVSTSWGAARFGSDTLQLPRFTPWDRTRGRFAARMVRNLVAG